MKQSKQNTSLKKINYRWAIVAMLFFTSTLSTAGGMITALLLGPKLKPLTKIQT